MKSTIPLFPEQGSTMAGEVDALFLFLLITTGLVALGVITLLLYFVARYRRRPDNLRTPRILGSNRLEIAWTVIPLVIFLIMFGWGARVYFLLAQPPEGALEIYVVGRQWMWKVQHPGGQREINEVHVPVGRPVKLILTSEDVIHSFGLPEFRTKKDVLPGRYVETWFQATHAKKFRLFCNQFCGTGHADMVGWVVAQEPAEYQSWLEQHAEGSLALRGRKLFLKLQCVTCHGSGPGSHPRAPILENLYSRRVALRDGRTLTADAAYIRESILRPRAKIVAGWEPIMPTFAGQVNEEEIIQLVAFLRSLGAGQTPVRTEEAEPPEAR